MIGGEGRHLCLSVSLSHLIPFLCSLTWMKQSPPLLPFLVFSPPERLSFSPFSFADMILGCPGGVRSTSSRLTSSCGGDFFPLLPPLLLPVLLRRGGRETGG